MKAPHFFHAALGALLLGCGSMAGAGVNSFTLTGPEGAYVSAIAAQPGQPEVVLASTPRGTYRSTNGGVSWTLTAPVGSSDYIAFDPSSPDRVYALRAQLHRSVDAGITFTQVSVPGAPQYLDYLAVSGGRVYVASNRGSVFRSDDGGENWTELTVPWPPSSPTQAIIAMAAAPTDGDIVYVCVVGSGTYKTVNAGASWTGPAAGSPCSEQFNYAWSFAVSPVDPDRVVAATSEGIYLSTTGNASWSVPSLIRAEWMYFDPAEPAHVVAVSQIGSIAHSHDGGATWPGGAWPNTTPWQNLQHARMQGGAFTGVAGHFFVAAYAGPLFSSDNLNTFSLRVGGMHAATVRKIVSADDGTIYAMQAAGSPGVWRRTPGGWVALDNDELRTIANNELGLRAIATAAEDSSLVYVVMNDRLLRSNNRGVDWLDQPPSITRQTFAVTVDPTHPQTAYVSNWGGAGSSGIVMFTTNGGANFSDCAANAPPLNSLRVDRAAPNVIYGIGSYAPYNRLYRSVDACRSWAPVTAEFPYPLNDFNIDPADHDKLYLASFDRVIRSRDGGANWTPINFGDPYGESMVAGTVLIDPVIPTTLWVTTISASGFARSVDDGATWQHVRTPGAGFTPVYTGVLDPLMPDTLVAGADSWGLVEFQVAPDLELSLDLPANPLPAGASTTATLNVNNAGPFDSSAADVTLALPDSIDATAVPNGCTVNARTVRCRAAPLHVGQSAAFALGLTPTAPVAAATLTATVSGHEADPNTANNSVNREVSALNPADLRVGVTGPADPVNHNATARITVTASNQGGLPASNATLQLNLTGFTSPAVTITQGSCAIAVTATICSIGTLGAGETVTATVDVVAGAIGANTLEALLREGQAGPGVTQSFSVTARPVADFSVETVETQDPVVTGLTVGYISTIRNNGPDAGTSTFSLGTLGLTATGVTITNGICGIAGGTTVICTVDSLAPGAVASVTVTATAGAPGTASASGSIAFNGVDPTVPNNQSVASTTVTSQPPPRSGGGGGGGGRFDWLLVALSGALLARRQLRLAAAAHQQRRQHSRA